jgi:uncharacterized protein with PIN domain
MKREQEIRERDEKIQKIMMRMGDVVVVKDKELIKKAERDYIQSCLKKDEESRRQDLESKQLKRQMNIEVRQYLESQVQDKKKKALSSLEENK